MLAADRDCPLQPLPLPSDEPCTGAAPIVCALARGLRCREEERHVYCDISGGDTGILESVSRLVDRLRDWDRRILDRPQPQPQPQPQPGNESLDAEPVVDVIARAADRQSTLDLGGASARSWPRPVLVATLMLFVLGFVWAAAAGNYTAMIVFGIATVGPARWLLR
jgi:hypothetical protein